MDYLKDKFIVVHVSGSWEFKGTARVRILHCFIRVACRRTNGCIQKEGKVKIKLLTRFIEAVFMEK